MDISHIISFRRPPLLGVSQINRNSQVNAIGRPTSSWHSSVLERFRTRGVVVSAVGIAVEGAADTVKEAKQGRRGNWVSKILLAGSTWRWGRRSGVVEKDEEAMDDATIKVSVEDGDTRVGCCDGEECIVGGDEDVRFDQRSFSRLLRRVSLVEASLYNRLAYLGCLAYSVPKIKAANLLGSRGLKFVTSSLEKISEVIGKVDKKAGAIEIAEEDGVSISATYEIAASAASYAQSHTKNNTHRDFASCDESSFVATTNSVTVVVAAEEDVKEAVAKDLNSPRSSPCEWFVCDNKSSRTRYFVIQGSESLASWQANLLFEPIQFEGMDFAVHRGIYEAAKGIYERMLPEVRAHLKRHGKSATMQFTGHSLGGSLSLLVNLMLLIRGEAPASSLLPVVTFGSPTVLCGGNRLLEKLGLSLNHVQSIMMHRDIVPRAFACNYPDHLAEILKAVNKNFRNHACLSNKKLLYEPMGELLILQPDKKFSPQHHLLPTGCGLYALTHPNASRRFIEAAQSFFLNSPHPLEILSDSAAYGANGTVVRDHDMISYVRSVRDIIRVEVKRIRKAEVERRRRIWTALVVVGGNETRQQQPTTRVSSPSRSASFAGVLRGGVEPLRRFGRLVTSQHVHMLVVVLLPARVLIMKALAVVSLS